MRVALVHHWFVTHGGGERVAAVLAELFPNADIFALVVSPEGIPVELEKRTIKSSVLQKIPGAQRVHRHFMPLYPYAVEQLDLTSYDLILTSDSGPMKGVITRPDATHICYCHSPMRYLWDGYHSYVSQLPALMRLPFSLAAHYVRNWDYLAAQRVTAFVANSHYVAGRIRHYYGRKSTVIYPPVEVSRGVIDDSPGDYYLAAGRLVGYKRTEILIEACNQLRRKLVVIGDGPELNRLKAIAGPTISFQGYVEPAELWRSYAHCRALLFAADEDFGMVPVEAQACGRPVIAFGKGGVLESVVDHQRLSSTHIETTESFSSGIFFQRQTSEDVMGAILRFEANEHTFSSFAIQQHTLRFDTSVFIKAFMKLVASLVPSAREIADLAYRGEKIEIDPSYGTAA